MARAQADRPALAAAVDQIQMHHPRGAGDGRLAAEFCRRRRRQAQAVTLGHGRNRQVKLDSASRPPEVRVRVSIRGHRATSGHQAEAVVDRARHAPALDRVAAPHHQTGGTATIEIERIPQAHLPQHPGGFGEGGPGPLHPLQGHQPEARAVAADHGAGGPLAQEGVAEPFGGSVQHHPAVPQQQRPASHDVAGLPQGRWAGCRSQPLPRAPGKRGASAWPPPGSPAAQRHCPARRARSLATSRCTDTVQHQGALRAAEGLVEPAPSRPCTGSGPAAHSRC